MPLHVINLVVSSFLALFKDCFVSRCPAPPEHTLMRSMHWRTIRSDDRSIDVLPRAIGTGHLVPTNHSRYHISAKDRRMTDSTSNDISRIKEMKSHKYGSLHALHSLSSSSQNMQRTIEAHVWRLYFVSELSGTVQHFNSLCSASSEKEV